MNYELKQHKYNYHKCKNTLNIIGRKTKCSKCDLYKCICQIGLKEFII